MFVVAARAATPDALLVGFSAGGIIGMVLAYRETPGSRQRFGFFALAAASLGCALLAKGPVGLILPMAVVVAHQWIETRRVRHFFSTLSVSIAAIAIALPWYVWVGLRTDGLWLRGFFLDHNLGRAMDSMEGHGGGVWYYPAAALLGLFPWSLIVIPVALWTRRNVRGSDPQAVMVRLGMVWLGMYIVAFSFASTKLPSYITPAYPGACLLIGGCLADWSERRLMIPRWLGRTAAVVFASAAVAIVVGLAVAGNQVGSVSIMGLSIVGSLFLWPALMAWRESDGGSVPRLTGALTGSNSWLPVSVLVSGCLLLLVVFGIGGPLADSQRNELDVFAMAGDERNSTDDAEGFRSSSRWLAVGTIEPSWVFYLREPIRECTLGIEPEVGGLRDAASHLAEPGNFVIVDQENLAALQSLVDSNVSYATVTCFRRFLRDETTIVLTSLPVGPGGIGQQGVQDRLERRTAEGSKNSHLERR
jgi:4-amino-4-deoxy-L-arabinose transferase-like glycosyltransferase